MGKLLRSPEEDGTNKGNPYHVQLPVFLLLALRYLKNKFLGLEGEHDAQYNPCNHNHDNHVRDHVNAPLAKGNVNSGLLQGALCRSVGRSADGRADTAKVCRHGDTEGKAYLTLVIGRKF